MPAKILVFEGGDAAGKKTQATLLAKRLTEEGKRVAMLSIPQYETTKIGGLLRECVDGKHGDFVALDPYIAATVFAAERVESLPHIQELCAENDFVLLDRYTSSNILHQGAKIADKSARHKMMRWIHELEHQSLKLPEPDSIFALAMPAHARQALVVARSLETGVPIDSTDQHTEHQVLVDTTITELPLFYPQTKIIECMEGAELRNAEDIGNEVYKNVCDIIEI